MSNLGQPPRLTDNGRCRPFRDDMKSTLWNIIRWTVSRALAGALAAAAPLHCALARDQAVLVPATTVQGVIEGESLGSVIAYRGIPYAAPPLGELRFRRAQSQHCINTRMVFSVDESLRSLTNERQ